MVFPCFHLLAHTARSVPDWKNSLKVINMYQPNLEYCIKWSRWFRGALKAKRSSSHRGLENSAGSCNFCLWLPNTPSNWWSRKANHSGMLRVWKEVRIIQNAIGMPDHYKEPCTSMQHGIQAAGELARGGRQLQREVMWQGPDALRKLWVYMSLHQWLHCGQRWKLVHNPDANRSGSIWPGTSRLIAGSFTHKQKCLDTQKRTTYVFRAA